MPQNQPMYRFIADDLRAKINDGRLQPNDKLSDGRRAERAVRSLPEHRQGGHQATHGRGPA